MSTLKYRPYFTLSELREIHSVISAAGKLGIATYLAGYIYGIEKGLRKPNISLSPTLQEKLGMVQPAPPDSSLEFRYLNNLMSKEEEREYEKMNGADFSNFMPHSHTQGD